MAEHLSLKEAQKLILLSQKLPPVKQSGSALDVTNAIIEHLGYIQIDTISAVQRAHHHTLWSRNPRYKTDHLDTLVAEKKVFEYWAHAAAYLPMSSYRYTLPRKRAIATGEQDHWYVRDKKLIADVLDRIRIDGPLMAKDFTDKRKSYAGWGAKPTKQALEYLFMMGELMISERVNFHKVYDLTERVLPSHVSTTIPSDEEYARFLITSYLKANGIGQVGEINYLLKNSKKLISTTAKEMYHSGELSEVTVSETSCYTLPNALNELGKGLSKSILKILSPFDNLLIQRKRMKSLFGYDYLLECYVPEAKRVYGYFSLPILWDGKLVARIDCKAERKESLLRIKHLALEPSLKKLDAFAMALEKELLQFMKFNDCTVLVLERVSPESAGDLFSHIG